MNALKVAVEHIKSPSMNRRYRTPQGLSNVFPTQIFPLVLSPSKDAAMVRQLVGYDQDEVTMGSIGNRPAVCSSRGPQI